MDDIQFAKIKKQIEETISETRLAGVRAEVLHAFLRAALTKMQFKWIQKKEAKVQDIFGQMEQNIHNHLVTIVETEEYNAVSLIVKDHLLLYFALHSTLLYERKDLEDLNHIVKEFQKTCEKKGLSKDIVKDIMATLNTAIDAWKAHIEDFRSNINNVYNSARGTFGSSALIGLSAFEKMHKEGYFARLKERSTFMEAYKDNHRLDAVMSKLKNISDRKELEKILGDIRDKEKEIAHDFTILAKLLFMTWMRIDENMQRLVQIVAKAAEVHELPARDSDQMKEILTLVNEKVNEKHLHSLRISNKQIETMMADVEKEITGIRKAA